MNLIDHAKQEFETRDWPGDCEMQRAVCGNILELLEVFSKQGHSGSSASYVLGLFNTLASFAPIAPLTGADNEWVEVEDGVYQNKRCSEVFKEEGEAYWIRGKIFRDKDGCLYTNSDSHVPISFPWTKPKSEIIDA